MGRLCFASSNSLIRARKFPVIWARTKCGGCSKRLAKRRFSSVGPLIFYENFAVPVTKQGFLMQRPVCMRLRPPPSSPPKLAVEDLPAERPIFGRFFAIVRAALASLRIGLAS
jgi:hypothetical protein